MIQKLLATLLLTLFCIANLAMPTISWAAEIHSADKLDLRETDSLNNAYLVGGTITIINTPVTNDVVIFADTATIKTQISGGVIAAAREINLAGRVEHNVRMAGATVVMDAEVGQDVLLAAADARLSRDSKVAGDVLFTGSKLVINGQVAGKVVAWCECQVEINGSVGSFEGSQVSQLSFGPEAVVVGNVTYQSSQEAEIADGADIQGTVDWQPIYGDEVGQRQTLSSGLLYGALASLVFCFALAYFFKRVIDSSLSAIQSGLLQTFLTGILTIFLAPLVATFFLIPSIWLGIASWLLLLLMLLTSYFLAQIVFGWWLLQWWYGRANQGYQFDWRAPLIGVLATSICWLVPVLGPIILVIFWVISLGALSRSLLSLRN